MSSSSARMGAPVVLLVFFLAASAVLCSTADAAGGSAAVLPLAWGDDSGVRRLQTAVTLGTPPQTVLLDVDITAEVSYIPCLLRQLNFEGDPSRIFRPANSSTYSPLSCNTLSCQSDPTCSRSCALFSNSITDPQPNTQPFTETISTFSSSSLNNMLLACKPARMLGSGVLALGAGELGVGAQGVREGAIEGGELSLCVGVEKGVAVVGKDWTIPKEVVEGMAHTRLVDITQSPGSYAVQVSEISISYNDSDDDDDKDTDVVDDVDDSDTNGDDEDNVHAARHTYTAVLSSMPEGLRLPSPAYSFVLDKVRKVVERVGGFSPVDGGAASHVMEVCFSTPDPSSWRKLPTIVLGFVGDDEAALTVPPRNYLYMHSTREDARCVGMFNNGVQSIRIGVELLRGVFVRIDVDNSEVGFARANCTRVAADVIGDAAVYNFAGVDVNATAPAYDNLSPAPAPGRDALNDTLFNMNAQLSQDNYTTVPASAPAPAPVFAPVPAPEPALDPESLFPLAGDMTPPAPAPASGSEYVLPDQSLAPAPGPEHEAESGGIISTPASAPPPLSALDAVQKQAAKLAEQTQSPAFKWLLVALAVLLVAWGVRSCCLRLRASFRRRHYKRVEDITKSIEL